MGDPLNHTNPTKLKLKHNKSVGNLWFILLKVTHQWAIIEQMLKLNQKDSNQTAVINAAAKIFGFTLST
jgi:hypothetical protein